MTQKRMFFGPVAAKGKTPHARFTDVLRRVLSVSKAELDRREAAWRAAGGGRRKVAR